MVSSGAQPEEKVTLCCVQTIYACNRKFKYRSMVIAQAVIIDQCPQDHWVYWSMITGEPHYHRFMMVETRGLEPRTSCVWSRHSNQLSYASKWPVYFITLFSVCKDINRNFLRNGFFGAAYAGAALFRHLIFGHYDTIKLRKNRLQPIFYRNIIGNTQSRNENHGLLLENS